MAPPLVPPIKCQGIKTKLIPALLPIADSRRFARWVEPFCGSCVVALNVQPKRALLADTNPHLIRLYRDIQSGRLTAATARAHLTSEGERLSKEGGAYFYEVRGRFNAQPASLDFLFLNRSCFNGLIRFNRKGFFNTPYGHKSQRFSQAYVTKIANQVARLAKVISSAEDWQFEVADFRTTLASVGEADLVYADPPYAGRNADYFNGWSEQDEAELAASLTTGLGSFILSTWHSNEFRSNPSIETVWSAEGLHMITRSHFYHVGAAEDLRHPMIEALVANFRLEAEIPKSMTAEQTLLFI